MLWPDLPAANRLDAGADGDGDQMFEKLTKLFRRGRDEAAAQGPEAVPSAAPPTDDQGSADPAPIAVGPATPSVVADLHEASAPAPESEIPLAAAPAVAATPPVPGIVVEVEQPSSPPPTEAAQAAVAAAFAPLCLVAEDLPARCGVWVVTGVDAELLTDLQLPANALAATLLVNPGILPVRWGLARDWGEQLVAAGVIPRVTAAAESVLRLRAQLYDSDLLEADQLKRLGLLLECVGGTPNRQVDGLPTWLTAVLNDVIHSNARYTNHVPLSNSPSPEQVVAQLTNWGADQIAGLLTLAEVPPAEQPALMLLAAYEMDPEHQRRGLPADLPQMANYFAEHQAAIPPKTAAKLSVEGRLALIDRAEGAPALATALASVIGELAADASRVVRRAACLLLAAMPQDERALAVSPVLAKLPPGRAEELVALLARAPGGEPLLQAATSTNPKLAEQVDAARQSHRALGEFDSDTVPTPALEPLRDPPAAAVRAELKAMLDRVARGAEQPRYYRSDAAAVAALGEAELDELVEVAEGRSTETPAVLEAFHLDQVRAAAPSLSTMQLLRLVVVEPRGDGRPTALMSYWHGWIDFETDLRALEVALDGLGLPTEWVADRAWRLEPEQSWPWAAEHLQLVSARLDNKYRTAEVLRLLQHFPLIPTRLLPQVSSLAMGASRANRALAQRALVGNPVARELAEAGLATKQEARVVAAADWLRALADPASVPALKSKLGSERRVVVRAALLSALEASGEDLSAYLAPSALLAEAIDGLGRKGDDSLAWFAFDQLPTLHWRDGSEVDPQILTWWVVLANKSKDPNGRGSFDRYLDLLDPIDAACLGQLALQAWLRREDWRLTDAEEQAVATYLGTRRFGEATAADPTSAPTLEQCIAEASTQPNRSELGSAANNRGLLALTTRMPGSELASAARDFLKSHRGSRAQAEYLIQALYANGDPAAVHQLLSIARRFRMPTVQERARELSAELALERGWTADELADRTIPAAGVSDDGRLHLDYGGREFLGLVGVDGVIQLTTSDGKRLKSLPAANASDDPELVKETKRQLTASRKQVKDVLAEQRTRLREAMCLQRTWAAGDWQDFLAAHPLVGPLVSSLVWLRNPGPVQQAFRLDSDGSLIGVDDAEIELAASDRLSLAHGSLLPDAEVAGWRQHLIDYNVIPSFDQFAAPSASFEPDATSFDDLVGHLSDSLRFGGVAERRGYRPGEAITHDWFDDYRQEFGPITAVLTFTGGRLSRELVPCATLELRFQQRRRLLKLDQVPPVLRAECYADYAALAALGPFDPGYDRLNY